MKKTIIKGLLVVVLCFNILHTQSQINNAIKPYTDFLEKEHLSAKDYILSLFKEKDIVILCERDHRELTQYNFILDVIKDPYFLENVGVVFAEVGARNLNPALNEFLQNDKLSDEEIDAQALTFQRNCMFPLWEKPNFSFFIKGIQRINKETPNNRKIEMYPTDIFYVDGEPTVDNVQKMIVNSMKRDSLMADYIIAHLEDRNLKSSGQKALVIMNYRHAYKSALPDDKGERMIGTGQILFEKYAGRVSNVMINSYANATTFAAIQEGKWDAAFQLINREDVGFHFENSPFGSDSFDMWVYENDAVYKNMFDGFVFYLPIEKQEMEIGVPHLMEDGFYEKLVKRNTLYYEAYFRLAKVDREVPPIDKEQMMKLNEISRSKLHTLDVIKSSINQWLNK